jgi:tetratricopeptide (TPR) repeat protein
VDDAKIRDVLSQPRSGLLGEALVARGLLNVPQLNEALAQQLLGQVAWLSTLPSSTVFGIYEGQDYLARWGGPPRDVDPLAVIWRALRSVPIEATGLAQITALLEEHPLRLHPDARVNRFGFDAKERSLVDVIRAKPLPFAELAASGLASEALVQRVVGVLALTRHLDVGGERGPLDVEQTRATSPLERPRDLLLKARQSTPPSMSAMSAPASVGPLSQNEVLARKKEIESVFESLGKLSHYDMLGVGPESPASVIQSAFLQQAKRWHPDKLEAELLAWKPQVNRVFGRITEAHQVLTDPRRRAEYDRSLSGEVQEDEQEVVQRALSAAAAFQKAQVLVKRMEWDEALELANLALKDDPEQAEYIAFVAWLEARKLRGGAPEAYQLLLDRLSRASRLQPNNLKVRMYRADVLKAAGRLQDALREYRHVADADPNNVDAQRELRLHKMRAGTATNTSAEHRLFGKLFKKP